MRELADKVAVVTGGASGIGFALAQRFAAEGMRVVLADIEEDALGEAADRLRGGGAEVLAVPTDVSVAASVEALAGRVDADWGGAQVVCNNAGVGGGGVAWETPLEVWEWTLGVNLWGVIHGVHAFVPGMVERDEGHVVNTASAAGLLASPMMAAYTATKHAVVGLSESLLKDLLLRGSKVKVSVLCPGWINTRIGESDRNWLDRLGPTPVRADDEVSALVREAMAERLAAGMDPAEVAALVVEAVRDERFWILTHPEFGQMAVERYQGAAEGREPEAFTFG